jgi:hypothetical protein
VLNRSPMRPRSAKGDPGLANRIRHGGICEGRRNRAPTAEFRIHKMCAGTTDLVLREGAGGQEVLGPLRAAVGWPPAWRRPCSARAHGRLPILSRRRSRQYHGRPARAWGEVCVLHNSGWLVVRGLDRRPNRHHGRGACRRAASAFHVKQTQFACRIKDRQTDPYPPKSGLRPDRTSGS